MSVYANDRYQPEAREYRQAQEANQAGATGNTFIAIASTVGKVVLIAAAILGALWLVAFTAPQILPYVIVAGIVGGGIYLFPNGIPLFEIPVVASIQTQRVTAVPARPVFTPVVVRETVQGVPVVYGPPVQVTTTYQQTVPPRRADYTGHAVLGGG